MEKFCGKKGSGARVPEWYMNKDYTLIKRYIVEESEAFLNFYQMLKSEMPSIGKSYINQFSN
jgi:hypothetical protein